MKFPFLSSCLALLCVVGCRQTVHPYVPQPPAKVVQVDPSSVKTVGDLMPLDVGNRWTYNLVTEISKDGQPLSHGGADVTYEIVGNAPDGAAMFELRDGDNVVDRQRWRVSGETLYQVSGGSQNVPYSPPQPIVRVPAIEGTRFDWAGRGVMPDGNLGSGVVSSRILEPQVVDTGLGRLSSIPVYTVTRFGKSHSENTSWFRPGVGLVRLTQTTVTPDGHQTVVRLTLTNYALKR